MSKFTRNVSRFLSQFPQDSLSRISQISFKGLFVQEIFQKFSLGWCACIALTALIVLVSHGAVNAQVAQVTQAGNIPISLEILQGLINTLWMMMATLLVMTTYGGFAFLTAGFSRYKNVVNALTTNLAIFILTTLIFWSFGFALLFGTQGNGVIGAGDWFLTAKTTAIYGLKPFPDGLPLAIFFLFESALAGMTAMIVAGAIAERVKFRDFLIFTVFLIGIGYSLVGHWVWGGGWLSNIGFQDFAGSTVIHSVGGWAAFTGLAIVGPRMGKYEKKKINNLPGHSMSWAYLGCLMIWLGWFGLTGGSTFSLNQQVPSILFVTNLAAVAGGFAALLTNWLRDRKVNLSLIMRGVLAGLVAISGSCNSVSHSSALWIGAIAGFLAVIFIAWFDRLRMDDPVGILSVHLIGGLWGTVATGIFDNKAGIITGQFLLLLNQFIGIAAVGVFMIIFSGLIWILLKGIFGLRVGLEGEINGLDLDEHGIAAYSGFVVESAVMLTNPYAKGETAKNEQPKPEESDQSDLQATDLTDIEESPDTEIETMSATLENDHSKRDSLN